MNVTTRVTTFGKIDERALAQLERCADAGNAVAAVLCADHHVGYSQPIGGVVAYEDWVSPSGVGYDIACGNKAVKTNLRVVDWDVPIKTVMDEIVRRISFGVGRVNDEPVDHLVLEQIRQSPFAPQRQLLDLAAKQLGTVGAGNHYVDLFSDEDGWLWIGVHFGSRGFGHKTACGFLALAAGQKFEDRVHEGEMDSPPVLLAFDSELGQAYLEAMSIAGDYAYAGRDVVCEKVLEILGAEQVEAVHNHHNFAWIEQHDGRDVVVIRKGATPIWPGQRSFVGGSMGDISVIVEGVDGAQARSALYSTVHGAGRVLSRTQAAGKFRKVPHPTKPGKKIRQRDASTGAIDWPSVLADLNERGIELRGGAADEAPGAYKSLPDVLAAHAESTRVVHTLQPLGVAMAGADTFDPYKD